MPLPLVSRNQVTKAGDVLRAPLDAASFHKVADALDVLGDWRTLHSHPLQVAYMNLRTRAIKCDEKAVVSRRLKRIPSIMLKLQRQSGMQLVRMQDIGGCRAVVRDIRTVEDLASKFDSDCPITDYIGTPKPDGYRSLHLIAKYNPSLKKHEAAAGLLIEVQIRTHLQHAWATAVETVDSLLNQRLKLGGGDADWRRFFALASSVIAIRERCPVIPNTAEDISKITDEIRDIDGRLRVRHKLEGMTASISQIGEHLASVKDVGAYLLLLDLDKKSIQRMRFLNKDVHASYDEYLKLEKQYYGDPTKQVVHVYVNQVKDLRRAYPNYFLNVSQFLAAMRGTLSEKP
jgi:putative GTP pyrophosphokinase